MASTFLQRTANSASATKGTLSFWFKRSSLTSVDERLINTNNVGDPYFQFYFRSSNDDIRFQTYDGGGVANFITNRKFRDINAWTHCVIAYDTTQATSSNRVKTYFNGVQETSFSTADYPAQNTNTRLNQGIFRIGGTSSNYYFGGSVSHFHYCDGYAYQASDFGETDSTTGEWKIKTSPSVSYGTNGFFILKDGNSVTDQSGNGNNLTVGGGTLTKTEDNPSNVFATWNPLFPAGGSLGYEFGNTKLTNSGTAAYRTSVSTLGASTGKFYAEFKCEGDTFFTGVLDISDTKMGINDTTFGSSSNMTAYGYGIFNSTGNVSNNGSTVVSGYSAALSSGDILGVALDATNKKLYFAKNGTWQNSGDPTSGSTGTGAISLASGDRTWVFASSVNGTNISANFGNGYFKSTAVSSAGTNASGIGIFEYDVPTGYTALSTKGLNE